MSRWALADHFRVMRPERRLVLSHPWRLLRSISGSQEYSNARVGKQASDASPSAFRHTCFALAESTVPSSPERGRAVFTRRPNAPRAASSAGARRSPADTRTNLESLG